MRQDVAESLHMRGVLYQTVTNDTDPENVENYGRIIDQGEAYSEGFSRDFCDGQTSPLPPRWADDRMNIAWFYNRESAELVSQYLRGDLAERIAGGSLSLPGGSSPSWLADVALQGFSPAELTAWMAGVEASMPEILAAESLTRGQIESRLSAYIAATGNPRPSYTEFLAWLEEREGLTE